MPALLLAIALAASSATVAPAAADLPERLQFLETRLDEDAVSVQLWWSGWMGVYVIGIAFNSFNLRDRASQGMHVNAALGIGKSVIGMAELLWSLNDAAAGSDPLRAANESGDSGLADQVQRAEALLRRNAERAERRWHWLPHVINAAMNITAALIVWLGYGELEGLAWGALSLAVGEVTIFSYPWGASDHRDQYVARFGWAFP